MGRNRYERNACGRDGFSLLEVLLAISILAIGLLTLGFVLSDTMRGVHDDARIMAANQAAVAVLENRRAVIETDVDHALDTGETGDRQITVGGEVYEVSWNVRPMLITSTGNLSATSSTPDVFEVEAQVTSPRGVTRNYSTLVSRVSSSAGGGE